MPGLRGARSDLAVAAASTALAFPLHWYYISDMMVVPQQGRGTVEPVVTGETRRPPLSVRLPEGLEDRLRAHALARGTKPSPWVVEAITEKLDREERGDVPPEVLRVARAIVSVPPEVWRYLEPLVTAVTGKS